MRAARCRGVSAEEQLAHVGAHLGIVELVAMLGHRGRFPDRHGGMTEAHPESVERDLEQVAGRILDRMDPVPTFPELQERVLHQLLGVLPAAGDEVERLVQTLVLRLEESVEARPRFDALLVDPHHFALRSHRPWMRGRRDLLRMILLGATRIRPPGISWRCHVVCVMTRRVLPSGSQIGRFSWRRAVAVPRRTSVISPDAISIT